MKLKALETANMQDQLITIREACVSANPEIIEKKFGCIVNNKWASDTNPDKYYYLLGNNSMVGLSVKTHDRVQTRATTMDDGTPGIEIIGRKIGIAEILYAIGKIQKRASYYLEVGSGRFIKSESVEYGVSKDVDTGIYYNLLDDDITHQSPECVAFIYELLK